MKTCSKCKILKSLDSFGNSKKSKDNLKSACKECRYTEGRLYNENNKQRVRLAQRLCAIKNPNKYKETRKLNKLKNREKNRQRDKLYRLDNIEKFKEKERIYRLNNVEKIKNTKSRYKKHNKGRINASTAKRWTAKLNATPKWLTKFDHDYIKHIYIQAKELEKLDGIKRHVDHIIPLQGKSVCGFHIPQNLQILTALENTLKKNDLKEEKHYER